MKAARIQVSMRISLRFIIGTLCVFFGVFPIVSALAAVPDDFLYRQQWYLDLIEAEGAWDNEVGSEEVIVAVLDSGVDIDHPDLVENIWINTGEIDGDGIDNDHNGFIDDIHGWDFVDSNPDPQASVNEAKSDAVFSHGTVVAGVIGARGDNRIGITGLAWNVSIMPIRIIDTSGTGSSYDVRQAIVYAVNNGADVINLSLTSSETDAALFEVIKWAYEEGVVIVSSVGNDGADLFSNPVYPACYDQNTEENYVLGVAASNKLDQKASFSNFGAGCVDVVAPGVNIYSTVFHDPSVLLFSTMYGGPWEGTCVAAPIVSGIAALMKSQNPGLSPRQIMNAIRLSTDPLQEPIEVKETLGSGRVNAVKALEAASVFAVTPESSFDPTDLSHVFAFAFGPGHLPGVYLFDDHGNPQTSFLAYEESFLGGVEIGVGDVDGDGNAEVVAGAGSGGGPQVRVFDLDGRVLSQFFAFDESLRTGVYFELVDIEDDGKEDIIVFTEDYSLVRAFDQNGVQLFETDLSSELGEIVNLSVGQLDDDEEKEFVLIYEKLGVQKIRVVDLDGDYVRSITIKNNMFSYADVESWDGDADGVDELLFSADMGSSPSVVITDNKGVVENTFFAYELGFKGGVDVAAGDVDQNGEIEIYTSPRTNGGPHVRVFNKEGAVIGGFFAADESLRLTTSIAVW
jgi:subtilisin family serine protease